MKASFSEEILTVLYVFFRARTALKPEHIIDCLEDTSIDYFTAHQILEHLCENKNIFMMEQNGYKTYLLSPLGKETIEQFYTMIRASVRNIIDGYISKNLSEMADSIEVSTSACFSYDDKYLVMLKCYADNACIMDLTLTADSKESADMLINNWRSKSPEIYNFIMDKLCK